MSDMTPTHVALREFCAEDGIPKSWPRLLRLVAWLGLWRVAVWLEQRHMDKGMRELGAELDKLTRAQVSLGYTCEHIAPDPDEVLTPTRYDYEQVAIHANHTVLWPKGEAPRREQDS